MAIRTIPKRVTPPGFVAALSARQKSEAIAYDGPDAHGGYVPRKGRPSSGKQVVSLRLDPDIIAAFRATGPGWQARINEALRRAKP